MSHRSHAQARATAALLSGIVAKCVRCLWTNVCLPGHQHTKRGVRCCRTRTSWWMTRSSPKQQSLVADAQLRCINHQIINCSITAYGKRGPGVMNHLWMSWCSRAPVSLAVCLGSDPRPCMWCTT